MNKKVLIITKVFPQQRLMKWIDSFIENECNVIVITTKHNKDNRLFNYNINVLQFNRNDLIDKTCKDIFFYRRIIKTLKEKSFRPDIIFVRDIFFAKTAIKLKSFYSSKFYLDIADNYPEVVKQLYTKNKLILAYYNLIEKTAILASDLTFAVTRESKKYLINKHKLTNSNKIIEVRNIPINNSTTEFKLKTISKSEPIKLVYLGKYSIGIRDIKPVISLIKNKEYNVELNIISNDKEVVLKDVSSLKLEKEVLNKIKFIKPIENKKLHQFIKRFDIGLIPHVRGPATDRTEPNKLYDYVKAGLPILSSDNPSLIDSIQKNNIGLVYSSLDEKTIENALKLLIDNYTFFQENCRHFANSMCWKKEVADVFN